MKTDIGRIEPHIVRQVCDCVYVMTQTQLPVGTKAWPPKQLSGTVATIAKRSLLFESRYVSSYCAISLYFKYPFSTRESSK